MIVSDSTQTSLNGRADPESKPLLLLVTDQLPYPPRNGITLPVYNYLLGLQPLYKVQLVLFVDLDNAPTEKALAENEALFGSIITVPLQRRVSWRRLAGEIFGTEMYQHGFDFAGPVLPQLPPVDRLLVSPFSAVAKWHSSGLAAAVVPSRSIAAVNDCTAAEYFFRSSQSFGGWRSRLKSWVDRLRTPLVARIEARLLRHYNYVLLQTQTDAALMARLVSSDVAQRVRLAPNGVRLDYFQLTPSANSRQIIFVAELSGEYASIAAWLVKEVWPAVTAQDSECRLLIVGKGASPSLTVAILSAQRVDHVNYVPDLGEVYSQSMIALSPVFKGFGLINKSIEAMAAGVPVVGGVAAFNGINGFVDQKNGIAASSVTAEFANAILSLSRDKDRRQKVGLAGRVAVASQFRWESTVATIDTLLRP